MESGIRMNTKEVLDTIEKNQLTTTNLLKSGNNYSQLYREYCKPKLADMLASLKLDVSYEKAKGNYVYFKEETELGLVETPVLDLVSGFGSNFLGHNNPELKTLLIECFEANVPMFAQSAIRPAAAKLAKKLNELIPAKGKYFCNFTNSGAESIEAALKHSYKVRFDIVRREYEAITRKLNDLYHQIENEGLDVTLPPGFSDLSKFRDDIDEYNLAQYENFQNNPVICALKGAFHGKTSSALKITFNKTFREGFEGMSSVKSVFIDINKPERLPEVIEENQVEFLLPELKDNSITLKNYKMTKVFAMIMEVILGEGGVKVLTDETLETFAELHSTLGIPYIIDEIQTGSGRTGAIYSYTQTPLVKIEPEYVVLSKALGGGMVKIGALMVHEKVYDLDFGFLHTSTFAEDDISCYTSLGVLDILTRNNNAVLEEATAKGSYFMQRLKALAEKYPNIIKEVRGRGLMLGMEFQDLKEYGPIFRYAGNQGFISLLVASYVLHHHKIRLLAPLTTLFKGNPGKKRQSVLRLQPPATITHKEIDQFITAMDEVLNIIDKNNEYCLVAHLIGESPEREELTHPKNMPVIHPEHIQHVDFDARIGFLVHITELKHLIDYYFPALKVYSFNRQKMTNWWNQLCRFLEPDVMHRTYIESEGFVVETNLVSVPYLPKYMIKTYSEARIMNDRFKKIYLQEMQDKIQDATILARDLGDERVPTSIVGLGAYTSIVTDSGICLNDFEIPVTTGNAYTTALMLQGVLTAAEQKGLDTDKCATAVVGAAGNIGSCYATLMTKFTGILHLIGREGESSEQRLRTVRDNCLAYILDDIRIQLREGTEPEQIKTGGLAKKLYNDIILNLLIDNKVLTPEESGMVEALYANEEVATATGAALEEIIRKHYQVNGNPFIKISGMGVLMESDIVAIATNSSDAWLIGPEKIKEGAIVCCASVPSNLSETFKNHLDKYFVFDGGYAKLPEGNIIDFVGMPKEGMAYGCLSETIMLGFEGRQCSYAKGPITSKQVLKTLEMAADFGFTLGEFKLGDTFQRMIN